MTELSPKTRRVLAEALHNLQLGVGQRRESADGSATPALFLRVHGDPILKTPAIPVRSLDDLGENGADLFYEMRRIMEAAGGVGLAAQQAGLVWRVAIARLTTHKREVAVFVNPRIVERSPELGYVIQEGCLSAPMNATGTAFFRTSVRRHAWVVVEHDQFHPDFGKRTHRVRLEGFDAQILQHECDHLDGRCIMDKLPRPQRRRLEAGVKVYLMAQGRLEQKR